MEIRCYQTVLTGQLTEVPAALGLSSEFVTIGRLPPSAWAYKSEAEAESAKMHRHRTEIQPSD